MDALKKHMMTLLGLLMHPAVVIAICMGIEQAGPSLLTSLDLLPPTWRQPVSSAVMLLGLVARGVHFLAALAKKQEEQEALLGAAMAKNAPPKEPPP